MRKKCVHHNKPKRGPYPNARRANAPGFQFKDDAAREKALMRHAWYRKKKMWDALRASAA
jgi:hypothetical protein